MSCGSVHVSGRCHVAHGGGVMWRMARRMGGVSVMYLGGDADGRRGIADYRYRL